MKVYLKTVIFFIFSISFLPKNAIAQTCDGDNLTLSTMTNGTKHGKISITSSADIENGSTVVFKAGTSITLTNGFHAKAGSNFTAKIEDCNNGGGPTLGASCFTPDASIWNNPWLSCQTSANPNTSRGNSHWIRYDFGQVYKLSKMHVWNVNKVGESDKGFREVIIDYSTNGTSWTSLGNFQFTQGTEEGAYSGFEGANFNGINARYVLITAISNWGHASCSGISDVKFNIAPALLQDVSALLVARNAAETLDLAHQLNRVKSDFLVYPNPTSNYTNVVIESNQATTADIAITDVTGRLLKSIPVEVFEGQNQWRLMLDEVPSGTYFVTIQSKVLTKLNPQKLVVVRE